jgi:hypothetical protein
MALTVMCERVKGQRSQFPDVLFFSARLYRAATARPGRDRA